jgi:uncharacterized protein YjbJ (UPF0337 family)
MGYLPRPQCRPKNAPEVAGNTPWGPGEVWARVGSNMKNIQSAGTKSGVRDEVEGTAKNLAGRAKEGAGKALGNPGLEGRGAREQLEGAIQKELGKMKRVFGK